MIQPQGASLKVKESPAQVCPSDPLADMEVNGGVEAERRAVSDGAKEPQQSTVSDDLKSAGSGPIYLDYNATTPIDPRVAKAMIPLLTTCWGNPSSGHKYGTEAAAALAAARAQVAQIIACRPAEIVFTSGGTESINHSIRGAAFAQRRAKRGSHIIISAVEHIAVKATAAFLAKRHGFHVTILPVENTGAVRPEALAAAVRADTAVVSIMTANNEVGTVNDIAALVAAVKAKNKNTLFHTDASQAVGKVPVDVLKSKVDYLTIAGHKLYAPKGVGALYIRTGTPLIDPLMHGAGHEGGRRAGTENVLLAVGLGQACALAHAGLAERMRVMRETRDLLEQLILMHFYSSHETSGQGTSNPQKPTPKLKVNGDRKDRLPNTLSISFRGVQSHAVLAAIQGKVACSAGSACHSHEVTISAVLKAMAVPEAFARGTLRLSTGIHTTKDEVRIAAKIICGAIDEAILDAKPAVNPLIGGDTS